MKYFVLVVLTLLTMFATSPTYSRQTNAFYSDYPDTADSIAKPKNRTNFNISRHGSNSPESSYPQAKNNSFPTTKKSISTTEKPRHPICVGNDCSCISSNKH